MSVFARAGQPPPESLHDKTAGHIPAFPNSVLNRERSSSSWFLLEIPRIGRRFTLA